MVELRDMHHDLDRIASLVSQRTRLIFIDNPNNPTGNLLSRSRLRDFLTGLPDSVIVVLDEAYIDFVDQDHRYDTLTLVEEQHDRCGVVLLRTFSKAYGLAGLRIGFGVMAAAVADCLHKVRQPFNINLIAQQGALAALGDHDFYQYTLSKTAAGKRFLMEGVENLDCTPLASQTNFFLIDVHTDATILFEAMLKKGVIIRSMKAYGFETYIRVNVGTDEENKRFLAALEEVLEECSHG